MAYRKRKTNKLKRQDKIQRKNKKTFRVKRGGTNPESPESIAFLNECKDDGLYATEANTIYEANMNSPNFNINIIDDKEKFKFSGNTKEYGKNALIYACEHIGYEKDRTDNNENNVLYSDFVLKLVQDPKIDVLNNISRERVGNRYSYQNALWVLLKVSIDIKDSNYDNEINDKTRTKIEEIANVMVQKMQAFDLHIAGIDDDNKQKTILMLACENDYSELCNKIIEKTEDLDILKYSLKSCNDNAEIKTEIEKRIVVLQKEQQDIKSVKKLYAKSSKLALTNRNIMEEVMGFITNKKT